MDGSMMDGLAEFVGCLVFLLFLAVVCLGGVALDWLSWWTALKITGCAVILLLVFSIGINLGR